MVIGCHASRAIHLEMLQDRSTESFIMALKRFSNRRGRPSIIHSDNAGEYVSGRNTIQEVFRVLNTERTHQRLQDELKLSWYLAPPRSPSHSGVIERLVKTIKNPLSKCLMDKLLTETEFYTVLTDVEASVNVRPLSSTSENPDDKNILPLTPSHIMLGRTLDTLPNEIHKGVEDQNKNKSVVDSWKERMKISNKFWMH